MEVLPAIDIRDGKVVRLAQGDYGRQTTYSDDALAVAGEFLRLGARWIHAVDLDAARSGELANLTIIERLCHTVAGRGAKMEYGGGLRDDGAVDRLLSKGVQRLVIGSAALEDWAWFESLISDRPADRFALGLDAREGHVAADGWTRQLELSAVELAARVRGSGLGAIVYTDIRRDGMLTGPNFEATAELIAATDVPVIASGGVACLDDVRRCKQIGCAGVIVGRAYYDGRIDLAEALRVSTENRN